VGLVGVFVRFLGGFGTVKRNGGFQIRDQQDVVGRGFESQTDRRVKWGGGGGGGGGVVVGVALKRRAENESLEPIPLSSFCEK